MPKYHVELIRRSSSVETAVADIEAPDEHTAINLTWAMDYDNELDWQEVEGESETEETATEITPEEGS